MEALHRRGDVDPDEEHDGRANEQHDTHSSIVEAVGSVRVGEHRNDAREHDNDNENGQLRQPPLPASDTS